MPARHLSLAIIFHRSKERSLDIIPMACHIEIVTDALRCLRMNGETPLLAAFAQYLQAIKTTIHVEVPDFQCSNLRAAKPDLQTHGEHGPITHTKQRCGIRFIQNGPRLLLRECQRHPFSAVDGWAFNLTHRVHRYHTELD